MRLLRLWQPVRPNRPLRPRRPIRLTTQVAALAVLTSAATAGLTAVLTFSLARGPQEQQALAVLQREALLTVRLADSRGPALGRTARGNGVLSILRAQQVQLVRIPASGPATGSRRDALTAADVAAVRAGRSVRGVRRSTAGDLLVDAEPLEAGGGVALVEPAGPARSASAPLLRRVGLALVLAVLLAGLVGVLLARRVTRPLRRATEGARALAGGHRGTGVEGSGSAEVVEIAEALSALDRALTASEAAQRDFLVEVSHELKTPLTAVRGFAEALADGVEADAATAGAVISAEAQRMDRLVNDLLDLARLRAERFSVRVAPVDLADVVAGAARVWESRCTAAGVVLEAVVGGPFTTVTDGGRLRQVLDVLLANALRVTPAGGRIALRQDGDGTAATVTVADTGPGLTDDDIAVAFVPGALHARYAGVRPVGSGVGLALAAALCGRLGLGVTAGRTAGGGARFEVRVPAEPTPQAAVLT